MKWKLEIFYQKNIGFAHEQISDTDLEKRVGCTIADSAIYEANERMIAKKLREVRAFFEYGGRQVILANLTSRGNVYIEAVEID